MTLYDCHVRNHHLKYNEPNRLLLRLMFIISTLHLKDHIYAKASENICSDLALFFATNLSFAALVIKLGPQT
ncbi:hypothetical protein GCM10007978_10080 [Shewanella hanedai]|jgi:hypothetical protein|nr:hypothetical protein GCM10007978_10080 [Shewanella hanedai]